MARELGRASARAVRIVGLVYHHDPGDVIRLGWEEFIVGRWEPVFTGYRSWAGVRRDAVWGDLMEAGLGCLQDLANRLVRAEIGNSPGRAGRHGRVMG